MRGFVALMGGECLSTRVFSDILGSRLEVTAMLRQAWPREHESNKVMVRRRWALLCAVSLRVWERVALLTRVLNVWAVGRR